MPATPVWLAGIETLLNRGIQTSTQANTLARRLDGTSLRVAIDGLFAVRVSTVGSRLALVADDAVEAPGNPRPDATINGSPFALLRLARGVSTVQTAPGSAAAQIRGDAEIANLYRQLLKLARPDFEEELSRLVGDLPARRFSQFASQAMNWARGARRTAGENVAEYLQEESRDLVNKPELEEFLQSVDALRDTADRIEARLLRLEQRLKGPA